MFSTYNTACIIQGWTDTVFNQKLLKKKKANLLFNQFLPDYADCELTVDCLDTQPFSDRKIFHIFSAPVI